MKDSGSRSPSRTLYIDRLPAPADRAGRLFVMTTAYSIKGGRAGRERLRVLSNIRQRGTQDFLDRIGVCPGMSCLDVGCGGGDVAREFARRIGVTGQVLGIDMDQAQLTIGCDEAADTGSSVRFGRWADITNPLTISVVLTSFTPVSS